MDQAIFSLAIALFTLALLVQAGLSKLQKPSYYLETVSAYAGVEVGNTVVRGIGVIEIVIALLVVIPETRSAGGLAAGALMLVYAAAMGRQLAAGRRDLRCGCSGPAAETRVGGELVIRNLILSLPMIALGWGVHRLGSLPELLVGVAFGGLLVLSYAATDQLIANRQKLRGWH